MKRGLGTWSLVATTYFLVSGGPYGLEELVAKAGWTGAVIALVATPIVWSLPTALLVGELAAALPLEGGYYAWVSRALGRFWGFQEAWLSLAASIFDMAIYPTIFTLYLGRAFPTLAQGPWPTVLGVGMIAVCAAWNARGARTVGGSAVVMTVVLLAPFAVLSILGLATPVAEAAVSPPATEALLPGVLVAMWNNMGWDNASTIAGEVDEPQRTYPRAMIFAVALVAFTYVAPVAALSRAGIDPATLGTGAWVDVAAKLGGPALGWAVTLGGVLCGLGMFNALVLSYSRLPAVLAADGYLPAILGRRHSTTDAPVVSIVVCAIAWTATLGLGFERLVEIDVVLYGISLVLEFVALIVLRIREPELPRPFKLPGGVPVLVLMALGPTSLLGLALFDAIRSGHGRGLWIAAVAVAIGPVVYLWRRRAAEARAAGAIT
jgi:amino acid transporter